MGSGNWIHGKGTYGVFSRPPHPLNDTHIIERHGCEEHLGRVGVAELEYEGPPWLVVSPDVCVDQYVEVMLQVEEAGGDRGGNEPHDERSRHGRVCKGHALRIMLPRSVCCYGCITAGSASCSKLAWRFSV